MLFMCFIGKCEGNKLNKIHDECSLLIFPIVHTSSEYEVFQDELL